MGPLEMIVSNPVAQSRVKLNGFLTALSGWILSIFSWSFHSLSGEPVPVFSQPALQVLSQQHEKEGM